MEALGAENKGENAGGAAPSKTRSRALLALKIAVTASALAFTVVVSRVSREDLFDAILRLSVPIVVGAAGLGFANLVLAAVRWRVLFSVYGATDAPTIPFLVRAQLVGHFYNTFVPGNVTGDVLRAHATRRAFPSPVASYMVVAIERLFGLAGLLIVGAVALGIRPLPGVMRADLLVLLAALAAIGIVAIPVLGRTASRWLPGRIRTWTGNLPVTVRPVLLIAALALSVVNHLVVALTGYLLIGTVAPQTTLADSLGLIPLTTVATYFPIAVAGLGIREAAFVFLFGKIGVASADATAASLGFFAAYCLLGGVGGVAHLLRPLRADATSRGAAPDAERP